MILLIGGTGQLGGLIARRLLLRGEEVRVLVRDPSAPAARALVEAGARLVPGDLTDPASLRAACESVQGIITTANSMSRGLPDTIDSVDQHGNANLIDAATGAGVGRFVFISALGADPHHPMPLLQAKGETEQRLRQGTLDWTVLQPDFYMDMLPMAVIGAPALSGGTVTLVGEGRRRHSIIAMKDVAGYAVAAFARPESIGRVLRLGGPEAVSWRDVLDSFERHLGREVPVRFVAPGQPLPGQPEMVSGLLALLETYDSALDTRALARSHGVVPTTLDGFVRGAVEAARGHGVR
ncbi:hypothetical protein GCM10009715_09750 [Paeniglutamicibacter psychrophenolicus]|uniref:NADH dehydrogenase n=1 Tax=Paeniglutamicibacter psychrophenolicus TaxID=257454 RepID=A0ABS4WFU3_9MICC|nr:SDR family oxidoreductase [Paeniglutamicibacter psychrophenolicus]MBP2375075.1 NADH dehydrogenase [Paeniglutamicibacter psychrophenolicus]